MDHYDVESEAEKFLKDLEQESRSEIPNEQEFENFMGQVHQVVDVIKSLASENDEDAQKGLMKADLLLGTSKNNGSGDDDVEESKCHVSTNRSVINKTTNKDLGQGEMSQNAFKAMVEKDAQERYENRQKRKAKSDEFKKKGNLLFKNKDFGGALYNYNEAIKLIKDSPCLYNNRALTYIRLGLFSEAIEDCDKCLQLDEFSVRGRLYKAKAHFLSGDATRCRQCLDETRKKMPGHIKMIEEYTEELFNLGLPRFEFDLDSEKKWKEASEYTLNHGQSSSSK